MFVVGACQVTLSQSTVGRVFWSSAQKYSKSTRKIPRIRPPFDAKKLMTKKGVV